MSSRTNLRPHPVVIDGDMSDDIVSEPSILQSISGVSYAVSWSGSSPVGTLSAQVSNDYSLNPDGTLDNPGTWSTIYLNVNGTPSQTIAITGNTGEGFIDIGRTMAYAVRLIYTADTGSGSLQVVINGKVS